MRTCILAGAPVGCSRMPRASLLVAAATAALALAPVASAAPRVPPPQPPQNPHLAANPGSNIHNDTWMTDAYRQAGPTGRDPVTALGALPPSLCSAVAFDHRG